MNHFEFFGLPVALYVDEKALRSAFLKNTKKFHPDFHALADGAQQASMLEQATKNNEAYQTLLSPHSRLRYVLELKGLIGQGDENPKLPQEFLMDIMDINENLMQLEHNFEQALFDNTINVVEHLENKLQISVSPILEHWDETTGTEEDLIKAKDYFLKRRYLLRIKENLSKFAPSNG